MAKDKDRKAKGKKRKKIKDLPPKSLQPDAARNVKGGIAMRYGSPACRAKYGY